MPVRAMDGPAVFSEVFQAPLPKPRAVVAGDRCVAGSSSIMALGLLRVVWRLATPLRTWVLFSYGPAQRWLESALDEAPC